MADQIIVSIRNSKMKNSKTSRRLFHFLEQVCLIEHSTHRDFQIKKWNYVFHLVYYNSNLKQTPSHREQKLVAQLFAILKSIKDKFAGRPIR